MSLLNTDVKYITSTMVGAPALRSQTGSLIALLDAFLKDGWGSQVPTSANVLDGVLSLVFPSTHAAQVQSVILVTATGPLASTLNGEYKVAAVDGVTLKVLITGLEDGAVTGITGVKMAPAGFNKTFQGTNLATYVSAKLGSHEMTLRVNDSSPNFARVVGYETMTSISTGTYPFPTNAQQVGGGYWDKATQTSGLSIPYALFSDGYSLIYCPAAAVAGGDLNLACAELYFFGDTLEESPAGDPFATLLSCSPVETPYQPSTQFEGLASSHWLPRARSAGVGALQAFVGDYVLRDFGAFPDQVSGKVHASKRYICDEQDPNVRAEQPGVLNGLQSKVLHYLPPYSLLSIEGRQYMVIPSGGYDQSILDDDCPVMYVDVTGPWRPYEHSVNPVDVNAGVQAFEDALEG